MVHLPQDIIMCTSAPHWEDMTMWWGRPVAMYMSHMMRIDDSKLSVRRFVSKMAAVALSACGQRGESAPVKAALKRHHSRSGE